MLIDSFIRMWEGFFYVFASNMKNISGIIKVQEKASTVFVEDRPINTLYIVEITYDTGYKEAWHFGMDEELRNKVYRILIDHQTEKNTFAPNIPPPLNKDGNIDIEKMLKGAL